MPGKLSYVYNPMQAIDRQKTVERVRFLLIRRFYPLGSISCHTVPNICLKNLPILRSLLTS